MAGSDYPETLQPNQTQYLPVGGADYIYCKFAERPIRIIENGKPVEMIAGDKYRPGHRFDSVYVHNPDKDNPLAAVLTIGTGDFDRQIVQGEIKAEPAVTYADGQKLTDTRQRLDIDLIPRKWQTTRLAQGTLLATGSEFKTDGLESADHTGNQIIYPGPDGEIWRSTKDNASVTGITSVYDPSLNLIRTEPYGTHDTSRNGQMWDDMAWTPDGVIAINTNGVFRVGNVNQENQHEKIMDNPFPDYLTSVLYTFEKQKVILGNPYGDWLEYDRDWNELASYSMGSGGNIARYNRITGELVRSDSDEFQIFDLENKQLKNTVSISYEGEPSYAWGVGFHVVQNRVYTMLDETTANIREFVLREHQTKPLITATPVRDGCGIINAVTKQTREFITTAQINVTATDTNITVEGELIKAALESLFQKAMPDNYLDHVFGIIRYGSGNSARPMPVNSGSQSFKRAEIEDQFSATLPDRLSITIDNYLTLGVNL